MARMAMSEEQRQTREGQLKSWMVRGLEGDAAAQNRLLCALAPLLRAFFARRLPGAGDDVEDLVQDTLIAIHTRRATYDPSRPFGPWAYAVARYKLIDHFRRHRQSVSFEDLEGVLVAEGGQDAAGAQHDVDALLDTLSPKQAEAIRNVKIAGLSVAEAAKAQGIGESDVKISVHRGLKALAARIRGK